MKTTIILAVVVGLVVYAFVLRHLLSKVGQGLFESQEIDGRGDGKAEWHRKHKAIVATMNRLWVALMFVSIPSLTVLVLYVLK